MLFNAQRRFDESPRFRCYGRPCPPWRVVDWPLRLGEALAPFTSRLPGHRYLRTVVCTPDRQLGMYQETGQRRFGSDISLVKGCSPNRQSIGQRRRWESNPLRPGCSRLPCRLAPASCPRQESNLVFDLRGVACASGTLRGQSRRLELHQHRPVYGTGASLLRPRRQQARSEGFEPSRAVLDTARSPRSTIP